MPKYQVLINDTASVEISLEGRGDSDLKKLTVNEYHLIHEGKSYHAEVLEIDTHSKTVKMLVNDGMVDCVISDELDMLLESMDLSAISAVTDKNLRSSMPGLVLDIMVSEGQSVSQGDPLMILEAMKMENLLKAPADGVISTIHCQVQDAVEKHQLLIEIS